MAEKKLQTRIINKHGLLTAWETSTLQLKEGEIALAKVMVAQKDGTEAPTYVAKIGLEGKTFNESPMLFAPASDVYEWAKAPSKPGYNASEIVRGTSNVDTDLAAVEEAVTILQGLVGSNVSVADAIKTAIEALDVDEVSFGAGKVVKAIKQVDGKIVVESRDLAAEDIPTLSIAKIDGLQAALDGKADKTSTEEAINAINSEIDTVINPAIEAAKKAGDDAQAYAEGVAGDLADYEEANDAALALVKETAEAATTVGEATEIANTAVTNFNTNTVAPLAERVTAVEGVAAQNTTDIAAEIQRATGVESGLDSRLTAAEGAINSLNAATTLEGVGTLAERPETGKADGAIYIATDNQKEYVWDGSKWVELGDTTVELQEINSLKGRMDAVESKNGTQDTAIGEAQDAADAAQASADAIYKVTDGTASGVLADEIARATKAESDNLATAKAYAEEKAGAAETAANGYTDGKIATVNESIETLSSTVSTNAETAANATKKVADDLATYIASNDTAVGKAQGDATQAIADAAAALKHSQDLAAGAVAENTEGVAANASAISDIQATYARVDGDKLVYGQGEEVFTIIFDCGGVTE